MKDNYHFFYTCSLGEFLVTHSETEVLGLDFIAPDHNYLPQECKNNFSKKISSQLDEYFSGKRECFDLTLNFKGTQFQKKVWKALLNIPYGKTKTYKEIAIEVGSPRAYRAVGSANNKNPIPIIIPCHRVIGSNGKLVGFAGGINLKEKLLNLEQKKKNL
ncbi:methylated-DNA--[protein]-cysteine S-methyltransferase [Fusobacterium sp. MFO224]|uniref:methylated-DNA--[protein]-cysteine S-methyltransferase n=1 Tax=Fusobacterium sp. MFO224 TaxID=3378070 RepID=UPI003852CF27